MGFWSKLFGTGDVVDKGMNMIDNAFYTDQEKAENKANILRFYEPFKIAQRLLAMTFCPVYCLAWFLVFVTELLSALLGNTVELGKVYSLLSGDMAIMVIIILTFYFGGGAAEGLIERLRNGKK